MEERLVQYNEHTTAPEDTTTVPVVPAPIVERAFCLLNLRMSTTLGVNAGACPRR